MPGKAAVAIFFFLWILIGLAPYGLLSLCASFKLQAEGSYLYTDRRRN
jgi:hypothetical protein